MNGVITKECLTYAELVEMKKQSIRIDGRNLKNKTYKEIFRLVKNSENWKKPVRPVIIKKKYVDQIQTAINYFVGGSEVRQISGDLYLITSKGYYHYIGA